MEERLHKTVRTPSRVSLNSGKAFRFARHAFVGCFAFLAILILVAPTHGQTVTSTSSQEIESPALQLALPEQREIQAFQQEQTILVQSLNALVSQGATAQQMLAWQEQNATALANQKQLALNLAAESETQPLDLAPAPNFPANASQTLKDFLTTQTNLAHARVQIHNQLLSALPGEVSETQVEQLQQSEDELFQQQHAADLQLQVQRAKTLAVEAAQQPMQLPPRLLIPSGVSPQMAAFLTARDQLLRDEITFANQYTNSSPETRDAALQQWQEQNARRFQQMQALALQSAMPPSTPPNQPASP